jgi:hypothetical protein
LTGMVALSRTAMTPFFGHNASGAPDRAGFSCVPMAPTASL